MKKQYKLHKKEMKVQLAEQLIEVNEKIGTLCLKSSNNRDDRVVADTAEFVSEYARRLFVASDDKSYFV